MKTFLVEIIGWSGRVERAAEYLDEPAATRVAERTFRSVDGREVRVVDDTGAVTSSWRVSSRFK